MGDNEECGALMEHSDGCGNGGDCCDEDGDDGGSESVREGRVKDREGETDQR